MDNRFRPPKSPALRIDRLTIRNFKGFADKTLEFPRPQPARPRRRSRKPALGSFHLLIGENGSGKTTALDALAVAVGVWQVTKSSAGWRAIRAKETRFEVRTHGDTTRFDPLPDPAITAEGVIGRDTVTWTRTNPGYSPRTSNQHAQEAVEAVKRLLARSEKREDVTLPVLAYYGAGRAWLEARERFAGFHRKKLSKVSRYDAYFYCLEGRVRQDDLNKWFLFEYLEAGQRGRKRMGLRAVESAVLGCIPEAEGVRYDFDRKEIVLRLAGRDTPFMSLSDGQRATLSLVADLAMKAVILNAHLGVKAAKESPGIVLIDELDLHLHPKWQREIVANLKRSFPNFQFIATTHSPFLIQSLAPGELIRLDDNAPVADYAGRSIEDIVETVQGVDMPQRSQRAETMSAAAQEYFRLVRLGRKAPAARLRAAERAYREASEPFTSQPALHALLKVEALAARAR